MSASLLGMRLMLLLGTSAPKPAPEEVIRAFLRAEILSDSEWGDGFQLSFVLGQPGLQDFDLLKSGALDPFSRVVVAVITGALPEVLIDGVITHHEVSPGGDGEVATLTVTGRDLSVMMDLEDRTEKYENQPDFVIFGQVIGRYSQLGLVPAPTPTSDVPVVLQRIPWQHETDLKFVQRMAKRNGYVFYIEPQTVGVNSAYFGPEKRAGAPLPALTTNMGSSNNVLWLRCFQEPLLPRKVDGSLLDLVSKSSVAVPAAPSLRMPPLSGSPLAARRTSILRDAAKLSPAQATGVAAAASSTGAEAVRVEGELDTLRYGAVLRTRQLVGVRGVGSSYNGNYYVRRVTHQIDAEHFTQGFTLSREGTGALLPVVVP